MIELSHQLAEVTCRVLRNRRLHLDLSQDTIASRTGLARTYISDVERGARHPTLFNLTLISAALEWSTSDLIRKTEIEVTKALDPDRLLKARRNEIQLHPLEQQLLHYIQNRMTDGVMISSSSGEFVLCNNAAKFLTGIEPPQGTPDEWLDQYGCFREDRVTPFHVQELPLVQALRGAESDHTPMFLRNSGLREGRYVEITGRPIKCPSSGTVKGAVIVFGELRA